MTSKELIKNIKDLDSILENNYDVMEYINVIASFNNDYINISIDLGNAHVIGNPTSTFSNMNKVISLLNQLNGKTLKRIRDVKPNIIVTSLNDLGSAIEQIIIVDENFKKTINDNNQKLIDFHTDAYSEKDFKHIFRFVSFCQVYIESINSIRFTTELFSINIESMPINLPPDNNLIEIQIVSELENLENFSNFISFIDVFYQGLCKSFDVHYEEQPLGIVKVESGSIYSKLFGNKTFIKIIRDFIIGIGNYIRDERTGNISKEQFQNNIKKASLIVDLKKQAVDAGMKEENIAHLEKVFKKAIDNISNSLPDSTTEIVIDNHVLLNLTQKQIKLIEDKRPLLLKKDNGESKKNK